MVDAKKIFFFGQPSQPTHHLTTVEPSFKPFFDNTDGPEQRGQLADNFLQKQGESALYNMHIHTRRYRYTTCVGLL